MQKIFAHPMRPAFVPGMLFLMLLLSQALKLNAQDVDFAACGATFPYTEVPANVAISPAITISGINTPGGAPVTTMSIQGVSYSAGGIEFQACAGPCASPYSIFGVDITVTGNTVTIDGTPDNTADTIIFTIQATVNATNCNTTFKLPIVSPVILGIVLDRSGSMGWGYNGNTSPPAGQRRWDGLVTGIGAMASQLGMNTLLPEDSVGLILFSSSLIPAPAPFNVDLTGLQANYGAMEGAVSGLTPGGSTALGDGILEARDRLLATGLTTKKAMIVFSDGVQNTGDTVKTVPPNQYLETDAGQSLSGGGEIDIYTICLGSSGHNPSLMQGIAAQNGGESLVTGTGLEADFVTFFGTHIVNILSDNSPQYIDIRKSSFPPSPESGPASVEETFPVNEGSSAVMATLIAPSQYEPHFTSFTKNGTEFIQFAQQTFGSGFVTIGLRLPADGLPGETLDGEWKVRMQFGTNTKTEVPYTLSIITDNHTIEPKYLVDKKFYKVGDSLNPSVTLAKLGKTLDNAQVEAIIAKPGDDVNDLIALANVDFDLPSTDPGSPDVAKLAVLLNDPEFLEKIKTNNQVITLTYDPAQEAYTGSFSNLDVTGVYQIFYRISADDPDLGKIERFHQKTIYVRFPDVDLPNSNISLSVNNAGNTVINWKPIASNGKLIGAGWGGAIGIEGADVTNTVDHGDGSYTLTLNATPDTEVTIHLLDEEVYTGMLEDFDGGVCKIFNIPCWLFWTIVILIIIIIIWRIVRKK